MDIFFIYPSIKHAEHVNHGVAALCGVIKSNGHNVDLYQPIKVNVRELYTKFCEKEYALCLVSAVTNQWPYALKLIKALKKRSDVMVILGGHHATSCPSILDENKEIDGICIGEGDAALGELLDKLENRQDYFHINSMWFRRKREILTNEIGDLINDLDSLPFPDYSRFSKEAISNRPALMFSRGCPYRCTYCCNNRLAKLYQGKGKFVRIKSVERAIEEVSDFADRYKPVRIDIDDDTFLKNKKWAAEFLKKYKMLTEIPFNCNTRPETLNEEICQALKKAGCGTLCIGIESGNEGIRKNVLKRDMSDSTIRKAFRLAHEHGIKIYSFNLVGVPGETYKDYLDTVRLNREIRPTYRQITVFYPYPGTELYEYAKEKGYLTEGQFRDSFFSRSLLTMKQFPKWKIKYAHVLFHFNVERETSLIKALYHLLRHYKLFPNIGKILKHIPFGSMVFQRLTRRFTKN